ncbi:glycosyltransferase family 4 protein [Guptibacillus hwajinpoensis]|uniref:Glycosyltransferase involved in cell wall biosynthesis n=1 Tax=Guptibacillus hwajinpoensis TaxID=208199 RepID=A0ABU0JZI4_9BACL|nr:glycosyltransferase family 4 protein [Alkalihalobacillus hemicentroti]MDQ0482512.1 glycosyltransferase involved in cell wall biosynthesis [Alkalihalobacillus hemicentroti]
MNLTKRDVLLVAPFTNLPGEKGFNRFSYIAKKLSEIGHNVTLVTSSFKHREKKFRDQKSISERYFPYNLVIIPELGYKKNVGFDRIWSHRHFAKQLTAYLNAIDKKPDVIYCAYPMMGAAFEVGKYAKRHKIPFILDIQDVWPESIKNMLKIPDPLTDTLLYPLTLYANRIYKLADSVVGVSQSYIARVEKANIHAKDFLPVYIGTDLSHFDSCQSLKVMKKSDEFWITYVGTFSYSYDIPTVIRAVAKLKEKGFHNIVFKVMGDGPFRGRYEQLASDLNAPVDFMGHLSYDEMVPTLVRSDIAANAISKGAQQSITNKIGDYVAAGLPILNSSQNKEFCDIVTSRVLGYNYEPGDADTLANHIESLYNDSELRRVFGANARKLAEEKFDRRTSYQDIYSVVENVSIG